jgi:hypothetical protein
VELVLRVVMKKSDCVFAIEEIDFLQETSP